jgi:hypothetical protein
VFRVRWLSSKQRGRASQQRSRSAAHVADRHHHHPPPPTRQDDDPYVRKTAAVCVAKLYDISAELVEDRGFLDMLRVSLIGRSRQQHGMQRPQSSG